MASCGREEQKQEPLDTKRKARLLCGQFVIFERSVVYPPHKTQGDSFTTLFRLWFLASGYHSKQSISRIFIIYSMKTNFCNGRVLITYLFGFRELQQRSTADKHFLPFFTNHRQRVNKSRL